MEEVVGCDRDRDISVLLWRVVYVLLALFLSFPQLFASEVKDRYRFCVRSADAGWSLSRYRPLINIRVGQVFEEARYTGRWLSLVRIREFDPDHEFAVEYRYNEAGKLQGMNAMLLRWGRWVAQSKLYPRSDGDGFEPFQVKFHKGVDGEVIADPEFAGDPSPRFRSAKVYRTVQEIPCAVLLRDAEKS